MPNWVVNKLTITGKNARDIINKHFRKLEENSKELSFDFNTLIPMPEELHIEKSSSSHNGLKLYLAMLNPKIKCLGNKEDKISYEELLQKGSAISYNENNYLLNELEIQELKEKYANELEETIELGKKVFDNYQKYGFADWYDWSVANWGTKWNACNSYGCDCEENPDATILYFDTAWSPAEPIVEELARRYPNLNVEYVYAEEQVALYTGYKYYENGELIICEDYDSESKEAYELYF